MSDDIGGMPDETIAAAFEHALTLMKVQPGDGMLAPLPQLDTDIILAVCEQVAARTANGDTVRDALNCALALVTGDVVASRALIDEGRDRSEAHREYLKRWALCCGELLVDKIDENIAAADAIGA